MAAAGATATTTNSLRVVREKPNVIISTEACVTMATDVSEFTHVTDVVDVIHDSAVVHALDPTTGMIWHQEIPRHQIASMSVPPPLIATVSPLNRAVWAAHMAVHPDRSFASYIMSCIDTGVPTYFEGPTLSHVYKNWKSCCMYSREVSEIIKKEVDSGKKFGPYLSQPLCNFVGSPMGAFQKPSANGSLKMRVITDLSWPKGNSVNDYISKEISSLSYISIDTAAAMCKN